MTRHGLCGEGRREQATPRGGRVKRRRSKDESKKGMEEREGG